MRYLVASLLLTRAAVAQQNACPIPRTSWPTGDWNVAVVDGGAPTAAIAALETDFFTLRMPDSDREGLRTDALAIVKGEAIIYERYARGYGVTTPHISWSVAKSVSSTLIGIAVGAGKLSLDDSICQVLTEYVGKAVCNIKVRNIITFSTGLGWQEGYESDPYNTSSVISMFFGEGAKDNLKFILGHKQIAAPGAAWLYSTGDAELAATVAKRALDAAYGAHSFWTVLFNRIGMTSAVVEQDPKGAPQGGSNVFATPRDYLKFGYLYLNRGCWNGSYILSPQWIADASKSSDAYVGYAADSETTPSGYMWWLNQPTPERKDSSGTVVRSAKPKPWADAPDDTIVAIGHWGQYVIVIPSRDVVIVRTGDDRKADLDINLLTTRALAVAQ